MKLHGLTRTIQPASLFTVDEAKLFMRVDHNEEDALIESLVKSATEWCENYTRRSFGEQTWELVASAESDLRIQLLRTPIISVNSVMLDDDPLAASDYTLRMEEPELIIKSTGRVVINYQAGYSSPPSRAIMAVKILAAFFYEHRSKDSTAPQAVENLLTSLRAPYVI